MNSKRWVVLVHFRPMEGAEHREPLEWFIEELEELQDLAERGPDWNIVEKYEILYNRKAY